MELVELAELDGLAEGEEGEELQPAAASATQPMDTSAATCTPRCRISR
jgi:hypothetical protein